MNSKLFLQGNWKQSLLLLLVVAVFTGPLLYSLGLIPSLQVLFYNFTGSAPLGIYFAALDQSIMVGDYVVIHPPEAAKPYLYGRRWTTAPYMLKQVAALPGAFYQVQYPWLLLGDKMAYIHSRDPDGLPMGKLPDGAYQVPAGQLLLISWKDQSFDSRYFGPVDQSLIVKKVVPGLIVPE